MCGCSREDLNWCIWEVEQCWRNRVQIMQLINKILNKCISALRATNYKNFRSSLILVVGGWEPSFDSFPFFERRQICFTYRKAFVLKKIYYPHGSHIETIACASCMKITATGDILFVVRFSRLKNIIFDRFPFIYEDIHGWKSK